MAIFDVSSSMVELLYVRDVWGLDVAPGVPICSPRPEAGTCVRPDGPGIEAQWSALWDRALVWTPAWPPEPADAGPSWVLTHGTNGLDLGELRRWKQEVRTDLAAVINAELALEHGKHQSRKRRRTTEADTNGVATVSLVPVVGHFASRTIPDRIIVSPSTFTDDERWTAAVNGAG